MQSAIDRYKLGTEAEVCASDFYGHYIPRRDSRFYCPECGEPVFWRSRGGSQPDKFCHYTKTSSSPECDKRVDGHSGLNLYQRVGLSVYLQCTEEGKYQLGIMFPALSENQIGNAMRRALKVRISSRTIFREATINHTYFQTGESTFIPVNFVPDSGENFSIITTPYSDLWLQQRWSDFADGFSSAGAIFTFDEAGGRKIHRGDSISTDKDYYVVAKSFHSPYGEIKSEQMGIVTLNGANYGVFRIKINVPIENETIFSKVNHFFHLHFSVWLLEKAPELVPLWPPVVEQTALVPIINRQFQFCAISSGNDIPSVFVYRSNRADSLTLSVEEPGINTAVIPLQAIETVLSVDRKYTGREAVFQKKIVNSGRSRYQFSIKTCNDDPLDINYLIQTDMLSALTFYSNAKVDIYIENRDKTVAYIPIRKPQTELTPNGNAVKIISSIEDGILYEYHVSLPQNEEGLNEEVLLQLISQCSVGVYTPAPRWIYSLLLQWNRMGYRSAVSALKRVAYMNKLPYALLAELNRLR